MTEQGNCTSTPRPDVLRDWLVCVMVDLSLSAKTISTATGGENAVGRFLSSPGRGIGLSRARDVEAFVRDCAAKEGKNLPEISGVAVAEYAAKLEPRASGPRQIQLSEILRRGGDE